jgi:hypothetical protein
MQRTYLNWSDVRFNRNVSLRQNVVKYCHHHAAVTATALCAAAVVIATAPLLQPPDRCYIQNAALTATTPLLQPPRCVQPPPPLS